MSSFSAGAITGGLNFDISPFTAGIAKAIASATTFPSAVASMIDAPLEKLSSSVGSALSGLGNIGKEMLPSVGVLQAVGVAAGAAVVGVGLVVGAFVAVGGAAGAAISTLADWTKATADAALKTALLADKAGVTTQYFSQLEQVGRQVSVTSEDIANGFKQIQNKAEMAAEGNKSAQKAFRDLGIPMQFVRANLGNMDNLFSRVHEKMMTIPSSAERTRRSIELLGKSGDNLKPLLSMDGLTWNKAIESSTRLGVVQTEASAKMAKEFNVVQVQFDQTWEGMKAAATKPIMQFFIDHWKEIQPVIEKVANTISGVVIKAVAWLNEEVNNGFPHLEKLKKLWLEIQPTLQAVADVISSVVAKAMSMLNSEIQNGFPHLQKLKEIFKDLQFGAAKVAEMISSVGNTIGALTGKSMGPLGNVVVNGYTSAPVPGWKGAGRTASGGGGDSSGDSGGGGVNVPVTVNMDPGETAKSVADKLKPAFDQVHQRLTDEAARRASHQMVAHAAGGR